MIDNQYNNFKTGVKNDIRGAAYGLFAGLGLFLLVFTLAGVVVYFFLKTNHYSLEIKATVAIGVLLLVSMMLVNRQFGNFIYLMWLKILIGVFMLLCLSIFGLILYCMWYLLKDYF
ncbi:hypothetical protein ABIB62_003276 [Mucilaginibacter sp. UYP25]|uniref:hypothetical protein n=1 Tax=unclassified Mucilaginibacter TaxID=2617802 RepID=UPI00339275A9